MKQILRKTFLTLLGGIFLSSGAWADDLPTPVYFNDFETAVSGSDGIEIVGNGVFESDADARFGKVFHNDPTLTKARRTNYLKLPTNILSHSGTTKEMSIGFWVNMKDAADFYWSPMFAAYDRATRSSNATEPWPMFVCMARKEVSLNCWGYCDTGNTYNDKGTNAQTSAWLDDQKWHYYTITLTATTIKVYIDGVLENSWTVDGTTDGQKITGVFEAGAAATATPANEFALTYICLGGNQCTNFDDPDPAFAFDDFAVYNKALTVAQINKIIANKSSVTKEISSTGWSTFAYDYPLDFTTPISGLSAYAVTGHSGTAITKTAVTGIVPAGTPLLLNGTASTSYTIPVATTAGTAPTGNKLVRGADAAVSATSGNTTYVLSKDGTKAVFKKIDTTPATVAKNQAYLLFNEVIAARSIDVDGDGTTGIQNLKVGKEDNVYYDLQGRRVLYPKKGLYIVNGKKVIINK